MTLSSLFPSPPTIDFISRLNLKKFAILTLEPPLPTQTHTLPILPKYPPPQPTEREREERETHRERDTERESQRLINNTITKMAQA